MMERNRGSKFSRDLRTQHPAISGFLNTEIERIFKERLPRNSIYKGGGSSLSIKAEDENTMADDDMISKLPDEVLRSVLSLLTMREAITASLVCRRWRHLWKSSLNLDFDMYKIGCKSLMSYFTNQGPSLLGTNEQHRFVSWVNQTLNSHRGERIESFRVECELGEGCLANMDKWIQFAAERNTEKLDISLIDAMCFQGRNTYSFPYRLFAHTTDQRRSCLQHLSLNSCIFYLPSNFMSFGMLRSLSVSNTCITKVSSQNILSSCPSLEWLSIRSCLCPVRLEFGRKRPSPPLKHLNIAECCHLKEIDISEVIHLVSFEYSGDRLTHLFMENTAQLVRLRFSAVWDPSAGAVCSLGGIAQKFSQIEFLMLSVMHVKDDMIPKKLPALTKLRQLVLMVHGESSSTSFLHLTSSLLKACPYLQNLEIHLPSSEEKIMKVPNEIGCNQYHRHKHLKEVNLYNFHGDQYELEVAIYFLKSALAPGRMKIVRRGRIYKGDGEWVELRFPTKIKRSHVHKLLGQAISTTQLVVL